MLAENDERFSQLIYGLKINRMKTDLKEFFTCNKKEKHQNCTCNLIYLISGSVAAIKAAQVIWNLYSNFHQNQNNLQIFVIVSKSASQFTNKSIITQNFGELCPEGLEFFESSVAFFEEGCDSEWNSWKTIGDQVLHIAARDWADGMLIAPLSANTLAKISNGFCDTLGTSILRAWDIISLSNALISSTSDEIIAKSENEIEYFRECEMRSTQIHKPKPVFLAPAMNTKMWQHPFTESQLLICENLLHFQIIRPISKKLACGEIGAGAMNEPNVIADIVFDVLGGKKSFPSEKNVVSSLFDKKSTNLGFCQ